jgi:hypothetical protein
MLHLEWHHRATKKKTTVETSMVPGSSWHAIKATTVIDAKKASILQLLISDERMSEFDDMIDFVTVRQTDRNINR